MIENLSITGIIILSIWVTSIIFNLAVSLYFLITKDREYFYKSLLILVFFILTGYMTFIPIILYLIIETYFNANKKINENENT